MGREDLLAERCHCGVSVAPTITPYAAHGGGGVEQLTYRCSTCTCAWTRNRPLDPETAAMQERVDSADPASNGSDLLGAMHRWARFLRDVGVEQWAQDLEAAAMELEAVRSQRGKVVRVPPSGQVRVHRDEHSAEFLHDDTCGVCREHRRTVDAACRAMLEELREALGEERVARPWTPQFEWLRLLVIVRGRG